MSDYQQAYEEARARHTEQQAKKSRVFAITEARRQTSIECKVLNNHKLCFLNMRFHHFSCQCECHKGEL